MIIEVRELQAHPVDFDEELEPGTIDFGADVHQSTDLKAAGRAQLVREHHGKHELINDIRLAGDFSTRVEMSCARCLEPISREVGKQFDLLYRPQGTDAGRSELSVTAAEAEVGYYQGEGLLLEDVLREQVLLALPLRAVCKDDCKGLCPHCGRNLNQEQCNCAEPLEDPRWLALKEIKEKLKVSEQ
ncbi:MAG: DNA-binding protein [Acidobacteria bacterium]|nr:MAG: DNA-binding protein [Acidobacteriota bacterium]